ncbi:MAG: hypothetical protein LBT10_07400 [Methanobrevibacter sp.]|nr:hypothetical protein [Methanobrevibacter sp.]
MIIQYNLNESGALPFVLGFFFSIIGILVSGLVLKNYEKKWSYSVLGMVSAIVIVIIFFVILGLVTVSTLYHY